MWALQWGSNHGRVWWCPMEVHVQGHGMGIWVVGMLHEVCAAMRMRCLVAVVGHTGQHAGF
jgi:hypothetical protein